MTGYESKRAAARDKLAQPEQEPVAYGMWDTMIGYGGRMMSVRLDKGQDGCTVPLYTAPPQRPWVGLTDEERVSFDATNPKTQKEWDELFDGIEDHGDVLTIAYQSGYYEGKKAALASLERNFCERCGKRIAAALTDIHTCTPPQEKNNG